MGVGSLPTSQLHCVLRAIEAAHSCHLIHAAKAIAGPELHVGCPAGGAGCRDDVLTALQPAWVTQELFQRALTPAHPHHQGLADFVLIKVLGLGFATAASGQKQCGCHKGSGDGLVVHLGRSEEGKPTFSIALVGWCQKGGGPVRRAHAEQWP